MGNSRGSPQPAEPRDGADTDGTGARKYVVVPQRQRLEG
jgi:hypothetical protein